MASMAIPQSHVYGFELVEKKVERIDAGLTFAQGMNQLWRSAFAAVHLRSALHSAVQVQDDLIGKLLGPEMQHLGCGQFSMLAGKVEHLVSLNLHILQVAGEIGFRSASLIKMQDQAEYLENIAESFRVSDDDEATAILAAMVKDLATNPSEQLIGSMHS